MTDDPFYAPNRPPAPSRSPQHGERLFEFQHGDDRYVCELLDHGAAYGVEAQFWLNGELLYSRRFDVRVDPTRPARELAIAWAEEERKPIEKGGA
jgi:hypothetical protein